MKQSRFSRQFQLQRTNKQRQVLLLLLAVGCLPAAQVVVLAQSATSRTTTTTSSSSSTTSTTSGTSTSTTSTSTSSSIISTTTSSISSASSTTSSSISTTSATTSSSLLQSSTTTAATTAVITSSSTSSSSTPSTSVVSISCLPLQDSICSGIFPSNYNYLNVNYLNSSIYGGHLPLRFGASDYSNYLLDLTMYRRSSSGGNASSTFVDLTALLFQTCPSTAPAIIPSIRYLTTFLCASDLYNSIINNNSPCQHDAVLPKLCTSTCDALVASLNSTTFSSQSSSTTITSSISLSNALAGCSSPGAVAAFIAQLRTSCYAMASSDTGSCQQAIGLDANACGFTPNSTSLATQYCSAPTTSSDSCCLALQNYRSPLSTASIIGITIGCLIGTVLLSTGMVFLVARLRSRKNRDAGITDTAADTALVKGTMLADEFGGGENYGSAGRNNTGLHQALYGSGGRQQQMMSLTTSSPPITTTTTAAAAAFTDIGNSSSYYSSSSVGGTSTMPLLLPPGTLLQEPTTSPSSLPPLRPDSILLQTSYIVVQDYLPQLSDEIELRVGDRVVLSACFSDGWAQGVNETTGAMGTLPIDLLRAVV